MHLNLPLAERVAYGVTTCRGFVAAITHTNAARWPCRAVSEVASDSRKWRTERQGGAVGTYSNALLVGLCRPALAIAAAFRLCRGFQPPLASTSTSVSMDPTVCTRQAIERKLPTSAHSYPEPWENNDRLKNHSPVRDRA